MKRLVYVLIILVGLSLVLPSNIYAASTLSFTPSSGTFAKDSTLRVSVYTNTGGEQVNAVQSDIAYPTDKLQFLSVSTSGSALTVFAEKSASGGVVHLAGGAPSPGINGSKLIATVTFKILADAGNATLSFTNDSAVLRDSDNANVLASKGSASYTFTKASSITTAPTTVPNPTESVKTNGLTNVRAVTTDNVTITWTSALKSDSEIEFGETTDYGFVRNENILVTNHSIVIPKELVVPGKLYYFIAKSKDAKGNEYVSEQSTFKMKGYDVVVRIKDAAGKPVSGAQVSLYSDVQIKETDSNGEAKFFDVSAGKHGLIVKEGSQTVIREIDVKDDPLTPTTVDIPMNEKERLFGLDLAMLSNFPITNMMIYGFLLGVLLLATLSVVIYIVKARKNYTE